MRDYMSDTWERYPDGEWADGYLQTGGNYDGGENPYQEGGHYDGGGNPYQEGGIVSHKMYRRPFHRHSWKDHYAMGYGDRMYRTSHPRGQLGGARTRTTPRTRVVRRKRPPKLIRFSKGQAMHRKYCTHVIHGKNAGMSYADYDQMQRTEKAKRAMRRNLRAKRTRIRRTLKKRATAQNRAAKKAAAAENRKMAAAMRKTRRADLARMLKATRAERRARARNRAIAG